MVYAFCHCEVSEKRADYDQVLHRTPFFRAATSDVDLEFPSPDVFLSAGHRWVSRSRTPSMLLWTVSKANRDVTLLDSGLHLSIFVRAFGKAR